MANDRGGGRGRGRGRGRGSRARGFGLDRGGSGWQTDAGDFVADGELNSHLQERIRGPSRVNENDESSLSFNMGLQFVKVEANEDIRRYLQQQETIRVKSGVEPWLALPEVPSNDEIRVLPDEEVELMPNKIRGKWKSTQRYLKAHFELLREDALSPLRDAVDHVKNNPYMFDNNELSIYEKVHLVGFTFSPWGVAARVQFSTHRAQRRILWSGTKRLTSGGLVALSPANDVFQKECILAVVAARPLSGVNATPPEIDLFFPRAGDMEIDPQKEFVMVEAKSGYYEAYRHTLQALQKMSTELFPLSSHICSLSPEIEAPLHIRVDPAMDLAPASADTSMPSYGVVDTLNNWPDHYNSCLDETQWQALNRILTKGLAIVQGPPGTGKTFVSTVALELLHSHLKHDDPPIIITAQTNHALDQLLTHVARFEPNYIRLGGRSSNAEVKKRALYEIRKANRIDLVPGSLLRKAINVHKQQSKELRELLEPLRDSVNPVDLASFVKHGAIGQHQADSLIKGAARWISADDAEIDPVEHWLGGQLSRFTVEYEVEDFGFEDGDEDLEAEQLSEQQIEDGVNDDEEKDTLLGAWCGVFDPFIADDSEEIDYSEEAENLLRRHEDLGKVPMRMRGHVYNAMKHRLKNTILEQFRKLAVSYQHNMNDMKIGRWERDICFLKQARIIGLTTTGLSKYRALLSALHPKIVLIEEAAEVLEAPVSVACMESVEHLILVGDHQQLRGHTSVSELEGDPYYLDVSLFERLVENNMPFSTLLRQRRMDPEFRRLIQPIYPRLVDHPIVSNRKPLDFGLGNMKSFFFDHRWLESKDSQLSTLNEEEARFIAAFYRHIVLNGLPASEVTILAFYNGQRKRLLKEIRAYPELKQVYNSVKTVDSYQGEENTVVMLSLARSNYDSKIGFLENRNRVCVALSRARQGFYLFGNSETLSRDPMWISVIRQMKAGGRFISKLDLRCKPHGNRSQVVKAEDLCETLGGCDKICEDELPCGHKCQLRCHPFSHESIRCGIKGCELFTAAVAERVPVSSDVRFESESSVEPRSLDSSELQPFMDGMHISGKAVSPEKSRLYLPFHQASLDRSRNRNRGMDGQEAGTRMDPGRAQAMGRAGTTRSSTRVTSTSRGRRVASSSADPFRVYSEQEQRAGRRNWNGFAQGGVIEDDIRRASSWEVSSADPSPEKPRGKTDRRRRHVLGERAQQIGGGRTRFVQSYRPAGYEPAEEHLDNAAAVVEADGIEATETRPDQAENAAEKSDDKLGWLIDFDD